MAIDHTPPLAVMRPRLPRAERLLPYLQEIDSNRTYSNHGPLAEKLARRLSRHYGVAAASVLPVCSATLGLSVALMAAGARRGTLAMMPSWTFVATGHAARAAGLEPFLVDVDEASGALTPAIAEAALAQAPGIVGAVIPVAPFGAPLDAAPWEDFRRRTNMPVVIDAAAGFDSLIPSSLPSVVSLHATKVLGAGEGGFIACTDAALMRRAFAHSNFGFAGERISHSPALNAKLSEYGAAVALAALDEWPARRAEWTSVLTMLHDAVAAADLGEGWPDGLGERYVSSTCCVRLPAKAARILAEAGIETRRWWQGGQARHPAFADCPATPLPVTERLAETMLGLPCFSDLNARAASRIQQALSVR